MNDNTGRRGLRIEEERRTEGMKNRRKGTRLMSETRNKEGCDDDKNGKNGMEVH
jgi:hypothetical protein